MFLTGRGVPLCFFLAWSCYLFLLLRRRSGFLSLPEALVSAGKTFRLRSGSTGELPPLPSEGGDSGGTDIATNGGHASSVISCTVESFEEGGCAVRAASSLPSGEKFLVWTFFDRNYAPVVGNWVRMLRAVGLPTPFLLACDEDAERIRVELGLNGMDVSQLVQGGPSVSLWSLGNGDPGPGGPGGEKPKKFRRLLRGDRRNLLVEDQDQEAHPLPILKARYLATISRLGLAQLFIESDVFVQKNPLDYPPLQDWARHAASEASTTAESGGVDLWISGHVFKDEINFGLLLCKPSTLPLWEEFGRLWAIAENRRGPKWQDQVLLHKLLSERTGPKVFARREALQQPNPKLLASAKKAGIDLGMLSRPKKPLEKSVLEKIRWEKLPPTLFAEREWKHWSFDGAGVGAGYRTHCGNCGVNEAVNHAANVAAAEVFTFHVTCLMLDGKMEVLREMYARRERGESVCGTSEKDQRSCGLGGVFPLNQ